LPGRLDLGGLHANAVAADGTLQDVLAPVGIDPDEKAGQPCVDVKISQIFSLSGLPDYQINVLRVKGFHKNHSGV